MACSLFYAAFAILLFSVLSADAQQSFTVEPSDTTATEGSALTLSCSISNKAGIATWIKGGNTPISVDDRIIDTANTRFSITGDLVTEFNLRIANANLTDAGEYTCQVSASGASSEIVSQAATVTILNVQKFSRQPADTSGAGDSTITMMCQVSNKEGSLSWRRDGFVISNETKILNSNPRFSVVGDRANGEYNLQIVGAQESDEGIYECFVTASGSSLFINSKEAFLSIISSGSQRLTIVPSDTIATQGTTTQLRCKVADKAGVLTWLQNGQAISFDGVVSLADERYSIVGNKTEGEFYLQITDLNENDQGTYYCIVNAEGNNDAISSSGANLVTLPAESPDAIYPQCFMTPTGDLREGDNITLSCLSRGGKPQPELFWLQNSMDFHNDMQQFISYTRNDVTVVLTNDLIGSVFECQATHPAYSSTKVCTLPPLIFELIPTIEVNLDTDILKVREDESGSITCTATGDPSILGYDWHYNGVQISDNDQRFVIESLGNAESVLTITSASLSMDESVISCEARNRVDTASIYAIVRIEEDNFFTILLAVLGLVAVFVFILIIFPCVFYYCWRKQNKKNKIRPHDSESVGSVSKLVQQNYFTEDETRTMPNGNAKRNKKSKVISHEYEGTNGHIPQTVILRGRPNGVPGSARRVSKASAFQDLYPPEPSISPMMNGKKASYDMQSGRLRSGSVLSSASIPANSFVSRTRSRSPSMAPSVRSHRGRGMTPEETLRKYNQKDREIENAAFNQFADDGHDGKSRSSRRKHRSKDEKKHKSSRHHKDKDSRSHKDKESKHSSKDHKKSKEHREKKHRHKKDKH